METSYILFWRPAPSEDESPVGTVPAGSGAPFPPLGEKRARDWALVLSSMGIPFLMRRRGGRWRIVVSGEHLARAMTELVRFELENEAESHARPEPPAPLDFTGAFGPLSLLVLFTLMSGAVLPELGLYPHIWEKLGSGNAARILSGEWWRLATSLSLHADAAHLGGNVLIGGMFVAVICGQTGAGAAWLLAVLSGVLGNLANVLFHGVGHDSIGFSTAVFGAAGVLSALRAVSHAGRGDSRWVPVAAGMGLLALLGFGGERTDIGAHVFGFAAGLGLGFIAGSLQRRFGRLRLPAQFLCGLAALAIPVAAWVLAFLS